MNRTNGKKNSPRTGVSSSNSTRTRPLRNCPGKKRSDEFSKRIRNLSNLRPPWGAMEPTSLKRDISCSLLAPPSRRNVYKLLDDAVLSSVSLWLLPSELMRRGKWKGWTRWRWRGTTNSNALGLNSCCSCCYLSAVWDQNDDGLFSRIGSIKAANLPMHLQKRKDNEKHFPLISNSSHRWESQLESDIPDLTRANRKPTNNGAKSQVSHDENVSLFRRNCPTRRETFHLRSAHHHQQHGTAIRNTERVFLSPPT